MATDIFSGGSGAIQRKTMMTGLNPAIIKMNEMVDIKGSCRV